MARPRTRTGYSQGQLARAMARRVGRKRRVTTPAQRAAARANLAKARAARKAGRSGAYGMNPSYLSRVSSDRLTKSGRVSRAAARRLRRPHPKSELGRMFRGATIGGSRRA